jgi:hypothetical protein
MSAGPTEIQKSSSGGGKIPIQIGARKRLLQVFNPHRPLEQRQATALLLNNQQYMAPHIRDQFLNMNDPVESIVQRLKNLADISPEYQKEGKPLLDKLRGFFKQPQAPERASS